MSEPHIGLPVVWLTATKSILATCRASKLPNPDQSDFQTRPKLGLLRPSVSSDQVMVTLWTYVPVEAEKHSTQVLGAYEFRVQLDAHGVHRTPEVARRIHLRQNLPRRDVGIRTARALSSQANLEGSASGTSIHHAQPWYIIIYPCKSFLHRWFSRFA